MQSTLQVARLRSAAAHQNRVLLRSVTASAGIRLGAPGYHPAQSQGHIKTVAMARAVPKRNPQPAFPLGCHRTPSTHACLQQGIPQSIPPVCTSRIASAVSSLCMACPISGCSPILSCRAFSKRCAPATCSAACREPESGLDSPCVCMTRTSGRILVLAWMGTHTTGDPRDLGHGYCNERRMPRLFLSNWVVRTFSLPGAKLPRMLPDWSYELSADRTRTRIRCSPPATSSESEK